MENGVYLEVFAMVDGRRINLKTISYKDLAQITVKAVLDGLEEAVEFKEKDELH